MPPSTPKSSGRRRYTRTTAPERGRALWGCSVQARTTSAPLAYKCPLLSPLPYLLVLPRLLGRILLLDALQARRRPSFRSLKVARGQLGDRLLDSRLVKSSPLVMSLFHRPPSVCTQSIVPISCLRACTRAVHGRPAPQQARPSIVRSSSFFYVCLVRFIPADKAISLLER